VIATCYVLGVSTRRLEKLAEALGITKLSKSQISEMAHSLDAEVKAFRTRPLDSGPYPIVWADALVVKVREAGRTVNVHVLVVTGVNALGPPERSSAPGSPPARTRPAGSLAGARSWHEGSRGWCS